MEEDINISFLDESGKINEITIIDKFTKNKKNYIIYYEKDNVNDYYSSLYEMVDNKMKIIPINDETDYDTVDEYLSRL